MNFVNKYAGMGVATVALVSPATSYAQEVGKTDISGGIGSLIKDKKLKLVTGEGKEFNPAEEYKNKPYILIFGLDGCTLCDEVAQNLKKIAEKAKGNTTLPPLVVIDVLPEDDNKEAAIKSMKKKYEDVGFPDAVVLYPSSKAEARALQDKLQVFYNPKEDRSHGLRIGVVGKDGICAAAPLGKNEKSVDAVLKAVKSLEPRGRQ